MRTALTVLLAGLLSGCKDPLAIKTDRPDYALATSSAPGLGMAPASPAKEGIRYHWRTSFGRFLRWEAPSYKVEELGADVRNGGEKVYWSCDPTAASGQRPEVLIELTAEDPSGKELARAGLRLRWEGDAAVVAR